MKAKFIYESLECSENLQFQRSSDPRQILNIGQRAVIEEWFRDIERQKGYNIDYTIDDKLNVVIHQNLSLYNLNIDWLPDNLTAKGSLTLSNTNITKLPENLIVGGSLGLENAKITELPDNLTVGGSLDLDNTKITKLPDNLSIGASLYLSNTKITELPDNLKVKNLIYISEDMKNSLVIPEHLRNKIKTL